MSHKILTREDLEFIKEYWKQNLKDKYTCIYSSINQIKYKFEEVPLPLQYHIPRFAITLASRCLKCGSLRLWTFNYYPEKKLITSISSFVDFKTKSFCGWHRHKHYNPTGSELKRWHETALHIIKEKKKDRYWWIKKIGSKTRNVLLAALVYSIALKEGKKVSADVIARKHGISPTPIYRYHDLAFEMMGEVYG